MKKILRALSLILLVPACSQIQTSTDQQHSSNDHPQSTLRTLSGTQMRYADNHAKYTFTFFEDGRYRLVSVSRNETLADTVEGRWNYEVTAAKEALLRLDGKATIKLQFTGPHEALGRMDNDVRVYKLHFTPRSS
jgi:hypothetical protein